MNIPDKVKIGGMIYSVEQTDNLTRGKANTTGETNYDETVIKILPREQQAMEQTFLHEVFHCIFSHHGYFEHDEKLIEELASALYMVIRDNPEIFMPELMIVDGSAEVDKDLGVMKITH